MLQKIIFQINELLNFLFNKEYWEKCVHKYFVQLYTNVSWAADHHIRMISEGSCDTEDWSNDAENSALITGINYFIKYIQTENSYFKL